MARISLSALELPTLPTTAGIDTLIMDLANSTLPPLQLLDRIKSASEFMPSRESTEMLIALIVYICGTVVGTVGMNVMKLALDRAAAANAKRGMGAMREEAEAVHSGEEDLQGLDGAGEDSYTGEDGSDAVRRVVVVSGRGSVDRYLQVGEKSPGKRGLDSPLPVRPVSLKSRALSLVAGLVRTVRAFPPLWWFGLVAFLGGQLSLLPTFAYAKQSLLCSLGSVCFPVNLLFVAICLRTQPPIMSWIGVCLIVSGDVLIVSSSSHQAASPPRTIAAMESLWTLEENASNVVYVGAKIIAAALGFALPFFRERKVRRAWRQENAAAVAAAAAMGRPGSVSDGEKAVVAKMLRSNFSGFCFAIASATLGSECMTFIKSCSLVVSEVTAQGSWEMIATPYFVTMVVLLLVMSIWWGIRLQMALASFDQLFIVSTMQVCWTLSTVLDGGMYFREFIGFTFMQAMGFVAGIAMIIGGVLTLANAGDGRDSSSSSSGGGGIGGREAEDDAQMQDVSFSSDGDSDYTP